MDDYSPSFLPYALQSIVLSILRSCWILASTIGFRDLDFRGSASRSSMLRDLFFWGYGLPHTHTHMWVCLFLLVGNCDSVWGFSRQFVLLPVVVGKCFLPKSAVGGRYGPLTVVLFFWIIRGPRMSLKKCVYMLEIIGTLPT